MPGAGDLRRASCAEACASEKPVSSACIALSAAPHATGPNAGRADVAQEFLPLPALILRTRQSHRFDGYTV